MAAAASAGDSLTKQFNRVRARRISGDWWAVGVLVALSVLLTWHLAYFDSWLEQLDISNQFMLWYAYLGKRLSEGVIPGWNPYQSSGAPFAGDPQSGWMYFPAMLLFPFFAPLLAFKLLIGVECLISGLTMYAFARVMRLGALASLAAALVFELNPFANSPAYCCTNRIQIWTWVPMLLLGAELALRAPDWRARIMPWCLSALALSQMYGGWLGQGTMYALILYASFLAYRVVFVDRADARPLSNRIGVGAATGVATAAISIGIGAAGLFPRYVVNGETLIGQGNYDELPGSLIKSPSLKKLILNILGSDNAPRAVAIGGVALVLIWLAPFLARRAYGTTYFAALTVCAYMLMLRVSPLHYAFNLIPKFEAIHGHNTINVSAIGAIGPAMLVGAAIETLPSRRLRPSRAALAIVPVVAIAAALLILGPRGLKDAGVTQIAAILATLIVVAALIASRRVARWGQIALVALIFALPTGAQMASAWVGSPIPTPWQSMAAFSPAIDNALAKLTGDAAPNEAGGFLQSVMAANGPFRFAGFTTVTAPAKVKGKAPSYIANRRNPYVLAILTNGRAIALELDDVSAYNPSQLARYVRVNNLINGKTQNYHLTLIMAKGFQSKLLDMLDVRYVIVDRRVTPQSSLFASIAKGRHPVYSDQWVTVYERDDAVAPAWIVHNVKRAKTSDVLHLISAKSFDPRTMAVVEGSQFPVEPLPAGSADQAKVTLYEPERVRIDATAASAGLLVASEVYEAGWKAYVDGQPVEIRPTNYALRGVALPAGHHTVEFRYEPASLRWGLWVSAITAMLIALAACWRLWAWRGRRRLNPTRAAGGDSAWPAIDVPPRPTPSSG